MRARVRGIYATALTRRLLDAGHDVVQASPPIRRRFDADFAAADHDVAVETTADRQGVGVAGDRDAAATVEADLGDVAIDALTWDDPAPRGAVFDGRVDDTLGNGAVVDLGDVEGFLPFRNADGFVEDGDGLRVQVVDPAAPWVTDRPVLDTDLRVTAGLATLVPGADGVRVEGEGGPAGRELAGITDLLPTDVPEGWGLRWAREAVDADMDALDRALDRAVDRAADLETALEEAGEVDPVRQVAAPTAGAWVWFGRESRFALDEVRRTVTPTMPGHHRTKAASSAASSGVDLAEALCGDGLGGAAADGDGNGDIPDGDGDGDTPDADSGGEQDFPFAVVTDQFGPVEGDRVRIDHGKPDGRRIVLGRGEVVERDPDGSVAVRRQMSVGGTYDALGTAREEGDTALTRFREGRWWYPTVYRTAEGESKGTYVNVCTPVEVFPEAVRYVDLEVDVVKHPDGTVERVDDDDLDDAVAAGDIPADLAAKARTVASSIERAL